MIRTKPMSDFDKTIGRLGVRYNRQDGKGMCVTVSCAGWTAGTPTLGNIMSLDEARDLHSMLDRMLAHVEPQVEGQ